VKNRFVCDRGENIEIMQAGIRDVDDGHALMVHLLSFVKKRH
jgi:hypothetical protein